MSYETQATHHSHEETALFESAMRAASEYKDFTAEQVQAIAEAVGNGCAEKAEFYAEWAVRDTGYGNVADKVLKKQSGSAGQLGWKAADYIEPQIDHEEKIISFPRPAGVIVGLMPCTNPVSTVFYLSMLSLFTRNAIILCPHPAARDCSVHATDLAAELAEKAGAPKGVIQILREPSISAVNGIMQHADANLVLAIGGPGMVHAAYSSGTPAIGVGAANIPAYVDHTANIDAAAQSIVLSSSFDNSLPCTTESVVLADESIAEQLRTKMAATGAYFVNPDEERKLRDFCWLEGKMNPIILGTDATWIAEQAGFTAPEGTKTLVVDIDTIGYQEPVSREKLWPVLGFKVITGGVDEAIKDGLAMLDIMGKGHSACVHSTNSDVIAKYSQAMPVCRVSINAPNVGGASGLDTNLPLTLMLGTGFYGGSSSGDNITPGHLIQWTRAAYNHDDAVVMGSDIDTAVQAVKNNRY